MRPYILALGAVALIAAAPTPAPGPATLGGTQTLSVAVAGVKSGQGFVHAELCPPELFLKDCPVTARAPATPGVTVVTFRNVPAGRYAIQAYHDSNGNARIDRGLFGIPREGVGFSNDARITLGPPKFASAAFEVRAGEGGAVSFKLRYF